MVDSTSEVYAVLGENCVIQPNAVVGFKYRDDCEKAVVGNNAVIRSFSIIYADVIIGDNFKTGHGIMIREKTTIGSQIVIGSSTVIDGNVTIGSYVKIESNVYIPTHTSIGSHVFIGPCAALTNDKYPQRMRDQYKPEGPYIEDSVSVGANSTILPGVRIGEGSFMAAGTVVTRDVPPWSLCKGVPGKIEPLPENLRERNRALKW